MSEQPQENQLCEEAEIIRDQSPRGTPDGNAQRQNAARRKPGIPTADQCVIALAQLPALMMTGVMSTTEASVTKGVYATVLQHLRQPKSKATTANSAPTLIEILRQQPSMFDSLSTMLTPEQLHDLRNRVNDASDAA